MAPSTLTTVDREVPTKVPILNAGDITPDVMRKYKDDCINFFDAKEIPADKQVRKILAGIKDHHIKDWIAVKRNTLLALTFDKFMTEFCANYLEEDWESMMRRQLLAMTQGTESFWNFAVTLQAKNSLLTGTPSYLQKDKLRHQIEAGIDAEKSGKINDFKKWLADFKCLDEAIRADRLQLELAMKNNCDANHCNNLLNDPSRHANTSNTPATYNTLNPSSNPNTGNNLASSALPHYAPKLTKYIHYA